MAKVHTLRHVKCNPGRRVKKTKSISRRVKKPEYRFSRFLRSIRGQMLRLQFAMSEEKSKLLEATPPRNFENSTIPEFPQ